MNISTLIMSFFVVVLSASIEVSSQTRGNKGVEIQDMVASILDQTKPLLFTPNFIT